MRRVIILFIAATLAVGGMSALYVNASGQVPAGMEELRNAPMRSGADATQDPDTIATRAEARMQTDTTTPPDTTTDMDTGTNTNTGAMTNIRQERTSTTGYVALGDSVAAGAGLVSLADTTTDGVCDRSSQAYPHLVAAELGTTVTHLACSGAKVDDGIYDDQTRSGTTVPPQLTTAFENGTPDMMTATIGANDVRWVQFIRQCYALRCGSEFDDRRAQLYRADLRVELYWMLYNIEQMSAGEPPRVFLSGYYVPFADLDCVATNRITPTEQQWLAEQTASLNQAIESIVPYFDFVEYVPVDFTGHELCAGEPWVQGVDDPAPFHPNSAGQAALARSFLDSMQN